MSTSRNDRIPFAKLLIVFAAAFLIAVGLFFLAGTLQYPIGPDPREKFDGGMLGDAAMLLDAKRFLCVRMPRNMDAKAKMEPR